MLPQPFSHQWVCIYSGPPGLTDLYADELRAEGIPAFIPDRHMKILAAPDVGGVLYLINLHVPRAEVARARELLGLA